MSGYLEGVKVIKQKYGIVISGSNPLANNRNLGFDESQVGEVDYLNPDDLNLRFPGSKAPTNIWAFVKKYMKGYEPFHKVNNAVIKMRRLLKSTHLFGVMGVGILFDIITTFQILCFKQEVKAYLVQIH